MYESSLIPREDGRPLIGLALGSGGARGWSHLGVLKALEEAGIRPDVVCGCSIGALVGAAYVSGRARELEKWVTSLDWQAVVGMLDISFRSGLIRGEKVLQYCAEHFFHEDFSEIEVPFACVATELATGREIWLRDGSISDAVRASIALPGLFSPVERKGRILVDGGLVNPVPVSLCRALGAEIVIAVELGSGLVGGRTRHGKEEEVESEVGIARKLLSSVGLVSPTVEEAAATRIGLPSLRDVVASSIIIMQMRIARSRLAGEPADVVISPRVAQLNTMDFHRATEAVEEGAQATARVIELLREAVGFGE